MRRAPEEIGDHLGCPKWLDRSRRSAILILAVPPMGAVVKYSVSLFGCMRGIRSLPDVFSLSSGMAGSHPCAER